jgi:hypothetical protein
VISPSSTFSRKGRQLEPGPNDRDEGVIHAQGAHRLQAARALLDVPIEGRGLGVGHSAEEQSFEVGGSGAGG